MAVANYDRAENKGGKARTNPDHYNGQPRLSMMKLR